jgi:hypothetical protein
LLFGAPLIGGYFQSPIFFLLALVTGFGAYPGVQQVVFPKIASLDFFENSRNSQAI